MAPTSAQVPVASPNQQVLRCWAPPSGSSTVRPITFVLRLDPDANLIEVETDYIPENIIERATRDAAGRAIKRCLPLRKPASDYAEWKETEVTFTGDESTPVPMFILPD